MTKKNGKVVKPGEVAEVEEEERNRFLETARKVLLAGIGAVGVAQDEIEDFVNRLVERGEIAERDARKLIREVSEKRRKSAEHEIDDRIDGLLDRMNVPSKSDIEALGEKIAALTHQVEDLKKMQA